MSPPRDDFGEEASIDDISEEDRFGDFSSTSSTVSSLSSSDNQPPESAPMPNMALSTGVVAKFWSVGVGVRSGRRILTSCFNCAAASRASSTNFSTSVRLGFLRGDFSGVDC